MLRGEPPCCCGARAVFCATPDCGMGCGVTVLPATGESGFRRLDLRPSWEVDRSCCGIAEVTRHIQVLLKGDLSTEIPSGDSYTRLA